MAVQHAMTLADQDNPEAHRRVVNWMRTNFSDTDVWGTMRTALAGCLRSDSPGSGRSALGPMNAILQNSPEDAWARLGLGLAYLRGGAPDTALDTLSTYEPSYWMAGPYYQTLACRALNDIERARELFGWGETQYRHRLTSAILVDTDAALHSALWGMRRGDSTNAWYDVRVAQLARAEASAAIDGQPRPDPWKHLLAARAFALLGDSERADAEFAAAEQAGGDDPEMWTVRGRVHARVGDHPAAERAFQRAIDLQPQNATWWIARGRYFAERGDMNRADADFTRA
ncbi:MAG: tetratricopeptide repeat protein, partial [Pirellulaceae bacterium]|nr:tetratricopeptide repeat protein [Pirellulaceae bacterium]